MPAGGGFIPPHGSSSNDGEAIISTNLDRMRIEERPQRKALTVKQERRLVDYLEERFMELMRGFKKRSDPTSPLQTLPSYLSLATPILSLILQIPPLKPSAISLRTTFLLRLTGDVMTAIVGYKPRVEDLDGLLEWLRVLDVGWEGVLRGVPWEAAILTESGSSGIRAGGAVGDDAEGRGRGGGEQKEPENEDESGKTKVLTQTEKTRLKSLLITGAARIDEWLEGLKSNDDSRIEELGNLEVLGEGSVGDYVDILESQGLRERFERLFERTLRELETEETGQEDADAYSSLTAGGIGSGMVGSAMKENGEVELADGIRDIESDSDEDT